jgi:hypothetical protein
MPYGRILSANHAEGISELEKTKENHASGEELFLTALGN